MIPLPFSKPRRLIRTPSPGQTTAIRVSLARKERQMTGLDAEIVNLKNKLAFLANEQKVLNKAVESHRALVSPINQLVPELLQEIFVHCLPVAHNAVMSAQEAPLLLCHVCHSWRQLAYATPYLWTSIHINLDNGFGGSADPAPLPDDVNSWLSRSKSLPLSISFHGPPGSNSSDVDHFRSYLEAITSVENRWKSFYVSTFTTDILVYLFATVDVAGPGCLEEVHVDSISPSILPEPDEDDGPNPYRTAFEIFLSLPKLHSLSLPYGGFIPFQPIADCKKLTHLGITSPVHQSYDLGEMVQVLLSVSHLQSLSISGFYTSSFTFESPLPLPTIHFSDLESLSMTDYPRSSHIWAFLRALHVPRLRHWAYDLLEPYYPFERKRCFNALCAFLSRLKEPLEEMDLSICSSTTGFGRFLDVLAGVKRLSVDNIHGRVNAIGDTHLNGLIEGSSQSDWEHESDFTSDSDEDIQLPPSITTSGYRCPQLEVFKCVCRGQSLSANVLLDFLRLRSGSGAKAAQITPLKKVVFLTGSPVSDELQEKVHKLLDGTGTMFNLSYI